MEDSKIVIDWFEKLTGFREESYEGTRQNLYIEGSKLHSKVNGKKYLIGDFQCLSLDKLREETSLLIKGAGTSSCELIIGDVKKLHELGSNHGAVFQVASQFNCLEMISPSLTPEDGVTCYQHDQTQGPACAIAAGAATIYRNYFVPLSEDFGQTSARQINTLKPFAEALARNLDCTVTNLWSMKNGYVLLEQSTLSIIDQHLMNCNETQLDEYRKIIQIGMHWDVEVTSGVEDQQSIVSQAFCSALPVSYNQASKTTWTRFAKLVLESVYEATILAAVLNRKKTGVNTVFLTLLGGGAFGNEEAWIIEAVQRSLNLTNEAGLDVKIVSFGEPSTTLKNVLGTKC